MGSFVGYTIALVLSTGISLQANPTFTFWLHKRDCTHAVRHLTPLEKRSLEGGFGRKVLGYRCIPVYEDSSFSSDGTSVGTVR